MKLMSSLFAVGMLQLTHSDDRASRTTAAAKGTNLKKFLTSRNELYFIHFLWDVVVCLSKVRLKILGSKGLNQCTSPF